MNLAFVLRMESDCTGGGLSSRSWTFIVVTEEQELTLETNKPEKYLVLVKRELWGEKAWYLRPLNIIKPQGCIGPMMGGNYAKVDYSVCRYPLPIHDRFETPETYNLLTM